MWLIEVDVWVLMFECGCLVEAAKCTGFLFLFLFFSFSGVPARLDHPV